MIASVVTGDSTNARVTFQAMKSRALGIDSIMVANLERFVSNAQSNAASTASYVENPGGQKFYSNKTATNQSYSLVGNYPNPFNPQTDITYTLPEVSYVTLKIFNVLGQEVKTLVDELQGAGRKTVSFDASTSPSGVYFYRLSAGRFAEVKKMLLLR